jgi:hypothetical protein
LWHAREQKRILWIDNMNTTEFLMEEFLQKLSKTSLGNNSGCIMSCAEIWELSQEKRYGRPHAQGYAAANNVPKGTAGTLRACAG